MSARVAWTGGGQGTVVSLAPKAVVVRSSVPSPPGSRLEGTLVAGAASGAGGGTLRVKVHGCRRQPEGDFLIEGRPIDLTREVREQIEAQGRSAAPGGEPTGEPSL